MSDHLVDLEIVVSLTLAHNIYNRSKSLKALLIVRHMNNCSQYSLGLRSSSLLSLFVSFILLKVAPQNGRQARQAGRRQAGCRHEQTLCIEKYRSTLNYTETKKIKINKKKQ